MNSNQIFWIDKILQNMFKIIVLCPIGAGKYQTLIFLKKCVQENYSLMEIKMIGQVKSGDLITTTDWSGTFSVK